MIPHHFTMDATTSLVGQRSRAARIALYLGQMFPLPDMIVMALSHFFALWFGLRVIFAEVRHVPLGPAEIDLPVFPTVQPTALGLAALAAVLLFGFRLGLAKTLAACALAGLALSFLHA